MYARCWPVTHKLEKEKIVVLLSVLRAMVRRLSHEEERDLMARVTQKDSDALATLYDQYSTLVFSLVLRIVKDKQEAEDLLQEIFLQVWDKAATFDSRRGNLYAWLMTLSRNRSIDRIRRNKGTRTRQQKLSEERMAVIPDDSEATPLEAVVGFERANMVRDALQQIPQEQCEVLLLAYFSGLSQSEIASQLQLPLGTVKTRTRQGMTKLQTILKKQMAV